MIKALKWAYDRGVQHERMRIAGHLRTVAQDRRSRWIAPLRAEDDLKSRNHDKYVEAIRREADQQVAELISFILEPQQLVGPSIMFPDDK